MIPDMAHSGGVCSSFVYELLTGVHDLSTDTIRCALYAYDSDFNPTNLFSAATTAYTTSNEVSGGGYSSGGVAVGSVTLAPVGNGWGVTLPDITFPSVTVSATQALIYNASKDSRAIAWMRFGAVQATTAADFTIRWDFARPPLIRLEV